MVAVALALSDPPQQSPIFGHRALSQTVCKFNPRRSCLIFAKFPPAGIGRFNHSGRRLVPGIEVCSGGSERKSEKLGPVFKVSEKEVWGRWFPGASGTVARQRRVKWNEDEPLRMQCEGEGMSIKVFHRIRAFIVKDVNETGSGRQVYKCD